MFVLLLGLAMAQDPLTSTTSMCVRRSVGLYTSGSETFVITDFGSQALNGPTICPNASVSTVSAPVSTVFGATSTTTVFAQSQSSCPVVSASTVTLYPSQQSIATPTAPMIVTNSGFENGTASFFNATTSDPGISAEVVQQGVGPLLPYNGNNYL